MKTKNDFAVKWGGTAMVLALIFILVLAFAQKCSAQVMEIFTNSLTSDYDSLMQRTEQEDRIWIIHHIHRSDNLDNIQSRNRHYDKGTGSIPEGFYNGIRMSSLVDTSDYQQLKQLTSPYSCEISVSGDFLYQTDMKVRLDWDISLSGEFRRVFLYITEDLCYGNWPNYTHNRVMRRMIPVAGMEFRNRLWITTIFNGDWNIDKCYFVISVEDDEGKVVGAKQMSLRESITTGMNATQIKTESKVWPNPATRTLKFSNNLTFLRIINAQGKIIKVNEPEKNRLDVSNLRPGLYIAAFKEGRFIRFIKR